MNTGQKRRDFNRENWFFCIYSDGSMLLSTPIFRPAKTPIQLFMVEPENTFVASWPYVWLPGFLVPTALFLHVISLRKLSK